MKKIIILLLPFFYSAISAQNIPIKDGKVVYEQVDTVKGTKDELYSKARIWMVNVFKNAQAVIQLEDKDAGQIIGKGSGAYIFKMGFNGYSGGMCFFSIQIDCRDNKARLRFYDISAANEGGPKAPIEGWNLGSKKASKLTIEAVDKLMVSNLASFKQDMNVSIKSDSF